MHTHTDGNVTTMKLPDGTSAIIEKTDDIIEAWQIWADKNRREAGKTVRAKFYVKQATVYSHSKGIEIKASPVYSSDKNSENYTFWSASPSGELTLFITNPAASPFFEVGKEYYVDFTKAPEATSE